MKPIIDYTLYLVTDRTLMSCATVEESVERAILGGCTVVQLREKDVSAAEFYQTAVRVKAVTEKYQVPLIINDRVDIALAVDAAGVHIGQQDLPADKVRHIIGEDKMIGVSVGNLQEAQIAMAMGADYLGVGAMYATATKRDACGTTMAELLRIRHQIKLPIIVIGGINKKTIPDFIDIGIDGIAVVSAIIAQQNIEQAARTLKELFTTGFSGTGK